VINCLKFLVFDNLNSLLDLRQLFDVLRKIFRRSYIVLEILCRTGASVFFYFWCKGTIQIRYYYYYYLACLGLYLQPKTANNVLGLRYKCQFIRIKEQNNCSKTVCCIGVVLHYGKLSCCLLPPCSQKRGLYAMLLSIHLSVCLFVSLFISLFMCQLFFFLMQFRVRRRVSHIVFYRFVTS